MRDAPALKPGDHVFLVDGSSFVFRAYFQSMNQDRKYNTRSDGLPTGAVRLFCTKIFQFVKDGALGIRPTHLAIIFDKSEKSFRKEIYPDYKAHRPDPPAELVPQFPLMRKAVAAFGLEPIELEGFEADDLIAAYAREATAAGARGADRVLRQGFDAAGRRHRRLLRPRIRHQGQAGLPARAPAPRRRGHRALGGHAACEDPRRAGAGRRRHRQCAGRAGHRHQDRRPADRRVRRSGDPSVTRGRDQAAQAAGDADRPGGDREGPHFQEAGDAGRGRPAAGAGGTPDAGAARAQTPDRLSQGARPHRAHPPHRRDLRRRPGRHRPRPRPRPRRGDLRPPARPDRRRPRGGRRARRGNGDLRQRAAGGKARGTPG